MPTLTVRRPTIAFGAALSATVAAILLAGCSSGNPGATASAHGPVEGGTLSYATGDAEPTCLDPHVGGNYPQALVGTQYVEELVSKNRKGEIIPWLASRWSAAPNGLSWTFSLKKGVTFTDGTPFDAKAVAANVAHVQNPETGSSTGYLALQKVASTTVIDDHTIRLNLSSPDSALLDSLTQPWVGIESPKALARSQAVNCASPVGTGPFTVTGWKKQDSITLERNPRYDSPPADASHQGPAHLSKVVWRFIPDSATRYAALQSGEVDVIDNAQPDTIIAARKSSEVHELNAPRPGASNRIELNAGKAPFNDEKVREAFVHGADINAGISSLFFGTATRSYSALSSVEPQAYSEPSLFDYSPSRANALLDAAGWTTRDSAGYRTKNGVRLSVAFPVSTDQSIPAEQSLFQQIQQTEKKIGFDVRLEPMDLNSWYSALGKNAYDAVSAPYTKVGPDVLRILYDSDGIKPAPSGYFANHAQTDIPALDSDLTRASQESNAQTRSDLYRQAQRTILQGYYILPLYDQQNHYLYRSSVVGLRALPSVSTPELYDAWLKR